MWEQRGLLGGCWKPQAKPQQAAAPLDHQSAIRTANSLCVCVWLSILSTAQLLLYDVSVLLFLSLFLFKAPAISQVRPEPIRGSLVESISLSLSLPVCLSLEPSLSALTLCHLTALPPNQALKGTFKRFARRKNTPWKQTLQCGQAMQDHFIHFKQLTRQFHYLVPDPRWPGLLIARLYLLTLSLSKMWF